MTGPAELAGPVVRCLAWILDFFVVMIITQALGMLAQVAGILSPDFAAAVREGSCF